MNNETKKTIISKFVMGAMLLFLMIQFHYVMVYFDDYGYYSLSYGISVGEIGHNHSFSELLEYLKIHYFEVNGRLPGYLLWLTLHMIGGLTLVQVSAAILVFLILIAIKSFVDNHQLPVATAVLVCLLYGLISQEMHRQGTYWFAAFFQYVAPVSAIIFFISYYFKHREKKVSPLNQFLLAVLILISAYSQEQLSITVSFMICLLIIFEWINKNLKLYHVIFLVVAACGVAALLFSPSSRSRASASGNPMILTMVYSTYNTIRTFFADENRIFIILLQMALLVFSFELYRTDKHIFRFIDICSMLFSVCSIVLYICNPILTWIGEYTFNRYYVLIIMGVPCIALIAIQIIRYYWKKQKYSNLLLFMTAVGSVGCLCFVPETPARLFIPSWLMLFPLLIDGIFEVSKLVSEKKGITVKTSLTVLCATLAAFSVFNAGNILFGYYNNYQAYKYNDSQLKAYISDELYKNEEAIYLKSMPVPECAAALIYDEEVTYMKYWIKEYYGITNDPAFYFSETADFTLPTYAYHDRGNQIYFSETNTTSN